MVRREHLISNIIRVQGGLRAGVDKLVQVSLQDTRCDNAIKSFFHKRCPGGGVMVSVIIWGLFISR
jgi:hypothetical protein